MVLTIQESGWSVKILERVEAHKSGPMDLCMKVIGKLIRQLVKVDSYMLMVMYILVIGKMTKLMAMASIHI